MQPLGRSLDQNDRLFWTARLFDGFRWLRDVRIELGQGGRIQGLQEAVTPRAGEKRVSLILPTLVNAHVHLELGKLASSRSSPDFLTWVGQVLQARASLSSGQIEQQARTNLTRLRRRGTGTLSEVDSLGYGAMALAESLEKQPFLSRCDAEVLGFDLDSKRAKALCESRFASLPQGVKRGLSPHAPYSVAPALFDEARNMAVPLSIHVSETPEELSFCREGRGPFRDLLEALGKLPAGFKPPGCSPLAQLHRLGLLGEGTVLIHLQELCPGDLEILEETHSPLVLCPGTIAYFGRPAPSYHAFREVGVPCALGTDSLASNEDLDMFREMERFHRMFPEVGGEEVLKMGTSTGGKVLGIPEAGRLREGAPFDALIFSDFPQGNDEETTDILLSGRIPPFIPYARGESIL